MRCSSCELLLDHYLEGTLRPRKAAEIATHVAQCRRCTILLAELRVIDGLLITARPADLIESDFTRSVISATAAAQPKPVRRIPFATALVAYLAIAWALAAFTFVRGGTVGAVGSVIASEQQSVAAIGAALRALAPDAPVAAAVVTGVLLLDLFLLSALVYGYRRLGAATTSRVIRGTHS